ncbi:hypothetical protein Syun_003654 [Stephania yunnanensis]|uniref:Myb-like domain-containing protein n=1 Tax=Stephania yunnanensis TaxID=152371 RepID=A0AAP0L359_9MAGN
MSTPQPPSSSTPPHQEQQPQQPVQSSIPTVKKISPTPWSHLETVRLIETYQEKWYSLKRGQLKANQWEEVAVTVAARCGYDEPSKTATQCRHKMEKLRKRYRSERQRCASNASASAWPYFHLMDYMERGPLPIAARPIASVADGGRGRVALGRSMKDDDDDDEDDGDGDGDEDEEDSEGKERSKSRSIHHILRKHPAVEPVWFRKKSSLSPPPPPLRHQWNNGGSSGGGGMGVGPPGVSRFMRNDLGYLKRRRPSEEDEEEEEAEEEEEEGSGGREEVLSELAAVVRTFGEGFVRMENLKMEMMKETERYRMEMETKRTEMIMESQSRIVEMIAKALGSQQRKQKKTQEA